MGQAARGRDRHFAGRGFRRLPRGVAALAAAGRRQVQPRPQGPAPDRRRSRMGRAHRAPGRCARRAGGARRRDRPPPAATAKARSAPSWRPTAKAPSSFPRDGMIVIGDHVIDASLRLLCRQRERYGLRPIIQRAVQQRGARWSSVPLGSPGCVDGPFLEGGDTLLNGYEIYVGISGCASDLAGVDWLQALLGDDVPGDPGGDEVERAAPRLRPGADQARPAGLLPAEAHRRPADVAARLGQDRGLGRRGQPAGDQRAGPRGRPRRSSTPTTRG